ncbi:MAG: hypothetical protein IPM04_08665 [Saprospiraceae bacterium]|jgi:hypothetical protein|nr:hypothetical protein [Candidatus Brachybacter algidus]MBK8747930.1 hypothetical protein [Candidatus Brachybacter algidus]
MKSINLKFNKSTSFRYLIFVLSLSSLSCVFTEAIMPEQNFIVSFEKNSTGMSFVTRIKVNSIDTFEISKEQVAYDIHVPELRWGQGILLDYTYRDNNPEKNSDLFYVAKDGVKVYSISIAEIKSMEYLMIGSKQIFILPEKRSK